VLIRNSVDGTTSLKIDAMTRIDSNGVFGVLVGTKVTETVNRRHTGMIKVGELKEEIDTVFEASKKYGDWLAKMDTKNAKDEKETLQTLFEQLPKVYTKGLEYMLNGVPLHGEPTVKSMYEVIAKRIWSEDTKMTTKLHLYQILNDTMFIVVGLDV
jgi:hypothetical protein